MKNIILRTTLIHCLLVICLPALSQSDRITVSGDATMVWGVPSSEALYQIATGDWNIHQSKGLLWEYSSPAYHFMKAEVSDSYPMISGSNDTIAFRNGNLYETLYLKGLNYHNSSYLSLLGDLQENGSSRHILSQLQPVAVPLGTSGKVAYTLDAKSLITAFPAAVAQTADGNTGIDYGALLPLLLQGISDLNERIERQKQTLDSLNAQKGMAVKMTDNTLLKAPSKVAITYDIPSEATSAFVQLCDTTGKQIRMADVLGTEKMTLTEGDLSSGVCYYSLIVDGTLIETKKITLQ